MEEKKEETTAAPANSSIASGITVDAEKWATDPRAISAPFPRRLYELLENEDKAIVSWTGDGIAFRIHNQEVFAKQVLLKYFRHSKLTSLQRQLNLYGFTHMTKGALAGSYMHPLFQRGSPQNLDAIKRSSKKSTQDPPRSAPFSRYPMSTPFGSMGWDMAPGLHGLGQHPAFPYGASPPAPFAAMQAPGPQHAPLDAPQHAAAPGMLDHGQAGGLHPGGYYGYPVYPGFYPGMGMPPPEALPAHIREATRAWNSETAPGSGARHPEGERAAKRGRPPPQGRPTNEDELEAMLTTRAENLNTVPFEPLARKLVESMGAVEALSVALALHAPGLAQGTRGGGAQGETAPVGSDSEADLELAGGAADASDAI